MDLPTLGVWWSGSWDSTDATVSVPADLEAVGYGVLWSSGGFRPGVARRFDRLLRASDRLIVASGIISIWTTDPVDLAGAVTDLDGRYPGRFLLGLGASHAPLVENYARPFSHVVEYLDRLDDLDGAVGTGRRALAALGPRMLELSATRAVGAHPYFTPVEHTARARAILGSGPLLAPEVTAVVEPDAGLARERARAFTTTYLALPNYVNNLRSFGYDDDDVADGGSDRLVDAVVAHGDLENVAARVREHYDAGADHVAVQLLGAGDSFPLTEYRGLASILL